MSSTDELWDSICRAADQRQSARRPKRPATPVSPTEQASIERALLDALCGGMTQWADDAQIFILHHWHCQCCGASGTFPNIEPGRLVRRHNRQGTAWTSHAKGPINPSLPHEFQHHHHPVAWCQHCIDETDCAQQSLNLQHLRPTHISPGAAIRPRAFV